MSSTDVDPWRSAGSPTNGKPDDSDVVMEFQPPIPSAVVHLDDHMSEDLEVDDDLEDDDYEEENFNKHIGHSNAAEVVSIYPIRHSIRNAGSHPSDNFLCPPDQRTIQSDMAASTRSLWTQDLDYREIHGRRYCKEYYMPNDEMEQLRLALLHQVFLHVFDGEMTTVPLEAPDFILDVGTGTGEWAIRLAELFPDCDVVGTDISAIAETRSVPMNVFFEIEDAEDWDRPSDYYDLIHFRGMDGAFRDWRSIYDNVYDSLKPGGWVEVADFDSAVDITKFFSQFSADSAIHSLFGDLDIASQKSGRRRGTTHLDPRVLMESGFVDVRHTEYVIPITIGEKTAGKIWLIACLDAIEATCLRLLTEHMGWSPETCKAACEEVARELAALAKDPDKANGLVIKLRVVVGRKPLDATVQNSPRPDEEIMMRDDGDTVQESDNETARGTDCRGRSATMNAPGERSNSTDSGLGHE